MVRLNELDEKQRIGLIKLSHWLLSFPQDTSIYLNTGRRRDMTHIISMIAKITTIGEYTDEERELLNNLRERYINNNIELGDLPF